MLLSALHVYEINTGRFPPTQQGLNVLVEKRLFKKIPADPWGKEYGYRFPGTHNKNEPDIFSAGPDGIEGTKDDIYSWDL